MSQNIFWRGFELILTGPGKEIEEEIEKEKLHVLEINKRQRKVIGYIKEKGKMTRRKYEQVCKISKRTAIRDLNDLVTKRIIKEKGKGPSLYYTLT